MSFSRNVEARGASPVLSEPTEQHSAKSVGTTTNASTAECGMSDRKTDAELIREAIEAGMVRKIPRGVSGDVKLKRGPAKNVMRIQRIRLLSARNFSDLEIADEIGSTQKAVSNTRYREGIPNGFRRRKGT